MSGTLHVYDDNRKRWVRQKLHIEKGRLCFDKTRISLTNSFVSLGLPPSDPSAKLLPPNSYPFFIRGNNFAIKVYAKSSSSRHKWYLTLIKNVRNSTTEKDSKERLKHFEEDLDSEGLKVDVTAEAKTPHHTHAEISPEKSEQSISTPSVLTVSSKDENPPSQLQAFIDAKEKALLDSIPVLQNELLNESLQFSPSPGNHSLQRRSEQFNTENRGLESQNSWLVFENYNELRLLTLREECMILSDCDSGELLFLLHSTSIVSLQRVKDHNLIKVIFFITNDHGLKQYDDIILSSLVQSEMGNIINAFQLSRRRIHHSKPISSITMIDVNGKLRDNLNSREKVDDRSTWKILILSHSNIIIAKVEVVPLSSQKTFSYIANYEYEDIDSYEISDIYSVTNTISFHDGRLFTFKIQSMSDDNTESMKHKALLLKLLLRSRLSFHRFLNQMFLGEHALQYNRSLAGYLNFSQGKSRKLVDQELYHHDSPTRGGRDDSKVQKRPVSQLKIETTQDSKSQRQGNSTVTESLNIKSKNEQDKNKTKLPQSPTKLWHTFKSIFSVSPSAKSNETKSTKDTKEDQKVEDGVIPVPEESNVSEDLEKKIEEVPEETSGDQGIQGSIASSEGKTVEPIPEQKETLPGNVVEADSSSVAVEEHTAETSENNAFFQGLKSSLSRLRLSVDNLNSLKDEEYNSPSRIRQIVNNDELRQDAGRRSLADKQEFSRRAIRLQRLLDREERDVNHLLETNILKESPLKRGFHQDNEKKKEESYFRKTLEKLYTTSRDGDNVRDLIYRGILKSDPLNFDRSAYDLSADAKKHRLCAQLEPLLKGNKIDTVQSLLDRGILTFNPLTEDVEEYKRQRRNRSDSVAKSLAERPLRGQLEEMGIWRDHLKMESPMKFRNRINEALMHRDSLEDLQSFGILRYDPREMDRDNFERETQQKVDKLGRWLLQRKSAKDLSDEGRVHYDLNSTYNHSEFQERKDMRAAEVQKVLESRMTREEVEHRMSLPYTLDNFDANAYESPSKRHNRKIEQHLSGRPNANELIDRNVLYSRPEDTFNPEIRKLKFKTLTSMVDAVARLHVKKVSKGDES
eukprot:g1705.t1